MHQTEPGILDPRIAVRRSTLADGRELLYFDDADTVLGSERAVDARALDPRPVTAEMRQDPLTGDWVSIAAARLPPAHVNGPRIIGRYQESYGAGSTVP